MPYVVKSGADNTELTIDPLTKAARVTIYPRGVGYGISSITGIIAAALAAGGAIFVARLDPSAAVNVHITRLVLDHVTPTAFGTPITAGRRWGIYRGSGAAASGGTALATAVEKDTNGASSEMNSANGGDMRISTTVALTVAGITFESQEIATMLLVGQGAAGAIKVMQYEWDHSHGSPLVLRPGELIAVRTIPTMDATGTQQVAVNMDWFEIA